MIKRAARFGKAIAAFQEPAAINRILEAYGLYRRTENTVTERQALLAGFAEIRARKNKF